jgi:predicted RNase H-like nuclease (RuvC/YqgF family)
LSLAPHYLLGNYSCQDLSSQNTTLHQHLESVSTQATRIRQAADASVAQPAEGEETAEDADSRLSELRSVVSYLRKEKGIVDLQLEMSKQENERLKAHIERLTQTLQETRDTLSNVRSFRSPVFWFGLNILHRSESGLSTTLRLQLSMQNSLRGSTSSISYEKAM